MTESILDKRRKEGWRITFWCEEKSVICQIFTPDSAFHEVPAVDVAVSDFQSAVKFAREVCRNEPRVVDCASELVFNWAKINPETFLALIHSVVRHPNRVEN